MEDNNKASDKAGGVNIVDFIRNDGIRIKNMFTVMMNILV